jgi:hypothetical protein
MSGQGQIFSESIDDVLTAVQETPRGRWFLDAFSARVKSEGTSTILNAIAKLESNLDRLSNSGASAELLEKARNAIAAARHEIAAVEPQVAKLSTEAKLFSNLAELSRKAFSSSETSPSLGKSVERALKLVADLDRDLNPVAKAGHDAVEFTAPPKPAVQYFKQDEEIFEPAPVVAPKTVNKPAEVAEISNKGAKLTIRRTAADKPAPAAEPVIAKVEEPVAIMSEKPVEAGQAEPSRIVIIRRKAEEPVNVPLLDSEELREVSAA